MTMSRRSTAVLASAWLAVMLAACTRTGPAGDAAGMRLPAPPHFMGPVPIQLLRADQDARDALARDRAALKQANNRLLRSRAWYQSLRQTARGQ